MTCLDYFYQLLSRKEYSANELLKKGQKKGFDNSEITKAINYIQSLGYQSDIRLAAQIISSSQGKYGKSVVKRKCLEKGIAADVFEQSWLEQSETGETGELVSLKAKVMRKYKLNDFQTIEPKTKAKLWNYLKYRGFNPFDVLEQWQREEEEVE
jgi:regulatory protein